MMRSHGMVLKVLSLWALLIANTVAAEEQLVRPYILSSHVAGDMVKVVIELKEALQQGGFELLGEYVPDQDRHVLALSHPQLRQLARKEPNAIFLAALSVAITRVADKLQIAYINPEFYAHAFHVDGELSGVLGELRQILGEQETFGASGLTPEQIAVYRYSHGMEQFEDLLNLAVFGGYREAVDKLESGIAAQADSVQRVFRLDIEAAPLSLFGVGFLQGQESDLSVQAKLDVAPLKRTARLPYLIAVREGRVVSLHPRYKLPLDFIGLERTGKHSFSAILGVPGAMVRRLRGLVN